MASVVRGVLKERVRPLPMEFIGLASSRCRAMVAVIVTITKKRGRRGRETLWQGPWGE